jgi:hypothetical protein
MPIKDKNARSNYCASYYREHREELKAKRRERYKVTGKAENEKAKERRRLAKEEKLKNDRNNGIWDF